MPLITRLQQQLAQAPDGAIVVAFSGGMDSSVLVHAFAQMPAARARGLRAIHVDHGLHPDSGRWSAQCVSVAREIGVPITVLDVAVDRESGTGLEDAARAARFSAFEQNLAPGEILALAQHRDDQAETILLKLLRMPPRPSGPAPCALCGNLRQGICGGHCWMCRAVY